MAPPFCLHLHSLLVLGPGDGPHGQGRGRCGGKLGVDGVAAFTDGISPADELIVGDGGDVCGVGPHAGADGGIDGAVVGMGEGRQLTAAEIISEDGGDGGGGCGEHGLYPFLPCWAALGQHGKVKGGPWPARRRAAAAHSPRTWGYASGRTPGSTWPPPVDP